MKNPISENLQNLQHNKFNTIKYPIMTNKYANDNDSEDSTKLEDGDFTSSSDANKVQVGIVSSCHVPPNETNTQGETSKDILKFQDPIFRNCFTGTEKAYNESQHVQLKDNENFVSGLEAIVKQKSDMDSICKDTSNNKAFTSNMYRNNEECNYEMGASQSHEIILHANDTESQSKVNGEALSYLTIINTHTRTESVPHVDNKILVESAECSPNDEVASQISFRACVNQGSALSPNTHVTISNLSNELNEPIEPNESNDIPFACNFSNGNSQSGEANATTIQVQSKHGRDDTQATAEIREYFKRDDDNKGIPEYLIVPKKPFHQKSTKSNDSFSRQCCICQNEQSNNIGTLPCCEHSFCFSCIWEWSRRKEKCPICRSSFKEVLEVTSEGTAIHTCIPIESQEEKVNTRRNQFHEMSRLTKLKLTLITVAIIILSIPLFVLVFILLSLCTSLISRV